MQCLSLSKSIVQRNYAVFPTITSFTCDVPALHAISSGLFPRQCLAHQHVLANTTRSDRMAKAASLEQLVPIFLVLPPCWITKPRLAAQAVGAHELIV
jgi:hypothetical protein